MCKPFITEKHQQEEGGNDWTRGAASDYDADLTKAGKKGSNTTYKN